METHLQNVPTPAQTAARFVEFVRTYRPPQNLFAEGFSALGIVPYAMFRLPDLDAFVAELREESEAGSERLDDVRVDATERGFVASFLQTMPSGAVYKILVRADTDDHGRIATLDWFCSGALRHVHATEVVA